MAERLTEELVVKYGRAYLAHGKNASSAANALGTNKQAILEAAELLGIKRVSRKKTKKEKLRERFADPETRRLVCSLALNLEAATEQKTPKPETLFDAASEPTAKEPSADDPILENEWHRRVKDAKKTFHPAEPSRLLMAEIGIDLLEKRVCSLMKRVEELEEEYAMLLRQSYQK